MRLNGEDQLDLSFNGQSAEVSSDANVISGLGSLSYIIEECCLPIAGERIVGLIDDADLVHIHQQDCETVMQTDLSVNRIAVDWKDEEQQTFPVDILINSYDRAGLLYDITSVLENERVNMRAVTTDLNSNHNRVDLHITIEIAGLDGLLKLLEKIERIPNVIEARRNLRSSG
jgi:GTP pyrophosphokinase